MAFNITVKEVIAKDKTGLLTQHSSWERVPLSEVATILNGAPFDSAHFSNTEGFPLIRIRDVTAGTTSTFYRGKYDEMYLVNSRDLLVGMDGDFNSAFWGSEPALLNQRVCKITPNENWYSMKLLSYLLPGYLTAINEHTSAITVKHLSSKTIGDIDLPLPPLNEQARIVEKLEELLSDLDAGVNELKAAQKKLGQYRQSLLKAAVEGDLTADWRSKNTVKETGAQLLQRILKERRTRWETKQLAKYKEQNKTPPTGWKEKYPEPMKPDITGLSKLPKGWVWASVEQLGHVQLGRQRSPSKIGKANPTPYIRAANITEDGVDLDDVLEMDFSETEKKTFALKVGDVLLTEASGSPEHVGRPAIWIQSDGLYCFQNTVLRFSPEGIGSGYAFYSFLAMQKLGVFSKLSGGVGINHLSAGKFSKLPVPLPPTVEQDALVDIIKEKFSMCERQLAFNAHSLKQSAAQRTNILKAAFSGQLVSQDPSDEPANVLLERIRLERVERERAPKLNNAKRAKAMKTIDSMSLRDWINTHPKDTFTFDDFSKWSQTDYETLKDSVFDLLSEKSPILVQEFDLNAGAMQFKRTSK